jgi:hypothetical protein
MKNKVNTTKQIFIRVVTLKNRIESAPTEEWKKHWESKLEEYYTVKWKCL